MGCTLLTHQRFQDGWKLYEFGLRTSAQGAQKWQRAMPKPFTQSQCKLWRGESLINKSILLLEEQAIGDVMQFMTLVPTLLKEAKHIGILVNNRLYPVYRRSLSSHIESSKISLWSFDDVNANSLSPHLYDFQCPLGSICQHRFTNVYDYGQHLPLLQVDQSLKSSLRNSYLQGYHQSTKLVGVSWRGGGRGDRIKQKSIGQDQFARFLANTNNLRFVNLQYGDYSKTVSQWVQNGVDIINDSTVNPLKDMDRWNAQVAACDAVISVANTTIHGAGGLDIPTMCLLSLDSDWRWFKDSSVKRSYWYPTVGIARQSSDGSWDAALRLIKQWLDAGAPYPTGSQRI